MSGLSATARRRRLYALIYGGCALIGAAFGIGWWASENDPVLGMFFLILAALCGGCYFLVTQPIRARERRDAERNAASAASGQQPSESPIGPAVRHGGVEAVESEEREHACGEILVERPKGYYTSVYRRFRILIDGEPAGAVKRGEMMRTTVTAGPHTVVAKIDWTGSRSVEVDVPPGGRVSLDVEPAGDPFAGMFSREGYLTLTVKPQSPSRSKNQP